MHYIINKDGLKKNQPFVLNNTFKVIIKKPVENSLFEAILSLRFVA